MIIGKNSSWSKDIFSISILTFVNKVYYSKLGPVYFQGLNGKGSHQGGIICPLLKGVHVNLCHL